MNTEATADAVNQSELVVNRPVLQVGHSRRQAAAVPERGSLASKMPRRKSAKQPISVQTSGPLPPQQQPQPEQRSQSRGQKQARAAVRGKYEARQPSKKRRGLKRRGSNRSLPGTGAKTARRGSLSMEGSAEVGPPSMSASTPAVAGSSKNPNIRRSLQVLDDAPDRQVDPLMEFPAVPLTQTPLPDHLWLAATDLWPLMDIYYGPPDTFSVAYLARLLGVSNLPPPVAPLSPHHQHSLRQQNSAVTSGAATNVRPATGLPAAIEFAQDASSRSGYMIPPLGRFAEAIWQRSADRTVPTAPAPIQDGKCDRLAVASSGPMIPPSDTGLLDYRMDPLYVQLVHQGHPHQSACAQPSSDDRAVDSSSKSISAAVTWLNQNHPAVANLSPSQTPIDEILALWVELFHSGSSGWHIQSLGEHQRAIQQDGQSTSPLLGASDVPSKVARFGWILYRNHRVQNKEWLAMVTYQFEWFFQGTSAELLGGLHDNSFNVQIAPEVGAALSTRSEADSKLKIKLLLVSMMIEHWRACSVWYGRIVCDKDIDETFWKDLFRCTPALISSTLSEPRKDMICDVHKCSYRYAFLLHSQRDQHQLAPTGLLSKDETSRDLVEHKQYDPTVSFKQRWLVRMPTQNEVLMFMSTPTVEQPDDPSTAPTAVIERHRARAVTTSTRAMSPAMSYLTSATGPARQVAVGFQAILRQDGRVDFGTAASEHREHPLSIDRTAALSLDILRTFELGPDRCGEAKEHRRELLESLVTKQKQLEELESHTEPKLRFLLEKMVEERRHYESDAAVTERAKVRRVMAQNVELLERRREMDLAFQKQLEHDMDAVCAVCNDGEVTPDNQILFCEACNVAVHQFCYGIEKIPEGDYYCLACTHLGRNKLGVSRNADAPKIKASPLPICCELCPLNQGAFIRTDVKARDGESSTAGKWVHMVCAKWQGLHFVDPVKHNLIEDVRPLKVQFRQHRVKCELCLGERGAMNHCRIAGCKNWIHVTCARAAGNCIVVHGENITGPVQENAWTLVCPGHSGVRPEDIPKGCTPVEKLISLAKAFPPEPTVDPIQITPKPFNVATGEERELLLANDRYEQELLYELTTKKLFGLHCEVCDAVEEEGKNLTRCASCGVVFCTSCKLDADGADGIYRCASCVSTALKKKGEEYDIPHCCTCHMKGGMLRRAFARPVNKKFWKANPKGYRKTLFAEELWIHNLCNFWNPKTVLDMDTGTVDLSQVVMSNGRGFISPHVRCFVCGLASGLKARCVCEGCRATEEGKEVVSFHPTCARQAGLEVNAEEYQGKARFYIKCYRHCGNDFNLRAKIEDLLEMEKKRAGIRFERADRPMKLADAQRVVHAAIHIMKVLGWAWRWAEWWVDFNSSWEPLLEQGEREEDMTKEQLKIVDSTRESRCMDARRCRLSAFGAALRNRAYDSDNGFDKESLSRALRAILSTESLAGPLGDYEKKFLTDWLGRAYRSNSRLLGFGVDKIPVSDAYFCVHERDKSPKFELVRRTVPGKQELPVGAIFEVGVDEVDDFMLHPVHEYPQKASNSPMHSSHGSGSSTLITKRKIARHSTEAAVEPRKSPRRQGGLTKVSENSQADTAISRISRPSQKFERINAVNEEVVKAKPSRRPRPPKSPPLLLDASSKGDRPFIPSNDKAHKEAGPSNIAPAKSPPLPAGSTRDPNVMAITSLVQSREHASLRQDSRLHSLEPVPAASQEHHQGLLQYPGFFGQRSLLPDVDTEAVLQEPIIEGRLSPPFEKEIAFGSWTTTGQQPPF